jgi:hypothetical protein
VIDGSARACMRQADMHGHIIHRHRHAVLRRCLTYSQVAKLAIMQNSCLPRIVSVPNESTEVSRDWYTIFSLVIWLVSDADLF